MAKSQTISLIIKGTDKASKVLKGTDADLAKLAVTGVAAVGAVVAFGKAAQEAFELGKEGAAIIQTEESFDRLLDTIGAAPDLLEDLQDASNDTVTEMALMSSTTQLLAGTSGELATALAASAPRLVEIAKAANKLNPTLGSTTKLYEQLTQGIKKGSPMRIDDLGITLKLGEANERYAKSIGKTVAQLTADEKIMALLNETTAKGQVLIDQVGGNTDSATDSFEQMEAQIGDLTNALKADLAPAITEVVSGLLDLITLSDKETDAIERATAAAERSGGTRLEIAEKVRQSLIKEMIAEGQTRKEAESRLAVTKKGHIAVLGFVGRTAKAQQDMTTKGSAAWKHWQGQMERTANDIIELWDTTTEWTEAGARGYSDLGEVIYANSALTRAWIEELEYLDDAHRDVQWSMDDSAESIDRWAKSNATAAAELDELTTAMGLGVTDEMQDYDDKMSDLNREIVGVDGAIRDLKESEDWPSPELIQQVGDLRVKQQGYKDEIVATGEAHKDAMSQMIFDMALAEAMIDGVITKGEQATLQAFAFGQGLVDEKGLAAWERVSEIMKQVSDPAAMPTAAMLGGLGGLVPGVAGAQGPVGLVENWGALAEEQLGLLDTRIAETTDPIHEIEIDIPDGEATEEMLKVMVTQLKRLGRGATIPINIKTTGAWPTDTGLGGPPYLGPKQEGGIVEETGLALVHKDELIIPASEVKQTQQMGNGGGGGVTYGDTYVFNQYLTTTEELTSVAQDFEMLRAMIG